MSLLKKNKIIQSGLMLMLLSAFLHMGILFLHLLFTFDTSPFNFFKIIGLDLFFPNFVTSACGNYIAAGTVVLLYTVIFRYIATKKNIQ